MLKYKLSEILAAWEAAYGEDMATEYPGFVQRLQEEKILETWESNNEQKTRASNGPRLPAALAMAAGPRPKLQAASRKL